MKFLILRKLQHSELGMFHAYRRSGREGSRQRAINFDSHVVEKVFPAATKVERIALSLSYLTDGGPRVIDHSLKRQAKNWRFEGNCPVDEYYSFVEPDCLFAMEIDAGSSPATGAWVVFPKEDQTAELILSDGATAGLFHAGMIALEPEQSDRVRRLLHAYHPDIFTAPTGSSAMLKTSDEFEENAISQPTRKRVPPNPERLADILGGAGHTLPSAVADIIDNSIEANASEIEITFEAPNTGHARWLVIRDNGDGMSESKLEEAMRIGSAAEYNPRSLGKFGYGLKGASWSQARAVIVVTKERGGAVLQMGWDKADMADWSLTDTPLEEWEAKATYIPDTGTAVLWKHMKSPMFAPAAKGVTPYVAEIQDLRQHLELVFHRFLEGDAKGRPPLTIRINGTPIEPNGPVSHPLVARHDAKTIDIVLETGKASVRVQPFVLPSEDELSQHHQAEGGEAIAKATDRIGYGGRRNDTQGLFIYRNDRLIKYGGWHGIWKTNDEKTKLARVTVEFDKALDEAFQINISKQSVSLPVALQEKIKLLADPVRKASQKKYLRSGGGATTQPVTTTTASSPVTISDSPSNPQLPITTTGKSQDSQPTLISKPVMTVRQVTTKKFAWQLSHGFEGERTLQVSKVIPSLYELANAIGSNPEAMEALAAFLEDLDQSDVQQTFIEDSSIA